MDAQERFLSTAEVKQMVGLKKSALYERISQGKFPRPIKDGRNRWLLSAVLAYMADRSKETNAKEPQEHPAPWKAIEASLVARQMKKQTVVKPQGKAKMQT